MGAPVILLVMSESLGRTEREIRTRYGSEYEVLRVDHASTAKSLLQALIDDGKEIALVVAGLQIPDETRRATCSPGRATSKATRSGR